MMTGPCGRCNEEEADAGNVVGDRGRGGNDDDDDDDDDAKSTRQIIPPVNSSRWKNTRNADTRMNIVFETRERSFQGVKAAQGEDLEDEVSHAAEKVFYTR